MRRRTKLREVFVRKRGRFCCCGHLRELLYMQAPLDGQRLLSELVGEEVPASRQIHVERKYVAPLIKGTPIRCAVEGQRDWRAVRARQLCCAGQAAAVRARAAVL